MNSRMSTVVKFLSCVALTFVVYIPTISWMVDRWTAHESYYSHGFLIPLISLYIVWTRIGKLKKVDIKTDLLGLWIAAGALLANILCASLKIYFASGFLFVLTLCGLVLFFFGREMARNLIFPLSFLLTMIPLPLALIGALTVKLKLFAAQISVFVLNHIGFPSVRDGSYIRMPGSFIEVAAPCSGLRSLVSLLTMGLLFAYAMKIPMWKKVILFISATPIALATNMMRIVMVAAVNDLYGEKVALGIFHDITGYLVFVVAFFGLLAVGKLLEGRPA